MRKMGKMTPDERRMLEEMMAKASVMLITIPNARTGGVGGVKQTKMFEVGALCGIAACLEWIQENGDPT